MIGVMGDAIEHGALEGKHFLVVERPEEAAETPALLRRLGARVSVANDAAGASLLARREEFDLAFVALGLGQPLADEVLRRLKDGARIPSILMLARPDEAAGAVRALSHGAADYLLKPMAAEEIRARIFRLLRWHDDDARTRHLQDEMSQRYLVGRLVSRSLGMQRVRQQIVQVAPARSTVLILGESGVGKELVAKAIHYNSPRRAGPFIALNCSAIPSTLIESELFGHEKGAFTGAVERQRGKFELAHGGTILLDEIGEMDLATQAKLLRVLEEREFMRVGGSRRVRVDVRLLAASNRDLRALIERGQFREDLYFRLNVITIRVPPLRGRREDLPELAQALLEQVCRDNGLAPRRLGESVLRAIGHYRWPGNVRELKNVLESAAITRPGAVVESSDLPDAIRGLAQEEEAPATGDLSLEGMERDLLRRTLLRFDGNRTRAARVLGIGVRTLQRKIQRYSLRQEGRRGRPRADQKSTETPSPGSSSRSRTPSRRRTPPRATSS
jgi:DNA-binding NtrC family response regulator